MNKREVNCRHSRQPYTPMVRSIQSCINSGNSQNGKKCIFEKRRKKTNEHQSSCVSTELVNGESKKPMKCIYTQCHPKRKKKNDKQHKKNEANGRKRKNKKTINDTQNSTQNTLTLDLVGMNNRNKYV